MTTYPGGKDAHTKTDSTPPWEIVSEGKSVINSPIKVSVQLFECRRVCKLRDVTVNRIAMWLGCGSGNRGAALLRMRRSASNTASGLLQSGDAWKHCTPHLFHNAKVASPNQCFFWIVRLHRPQTGLFTPWPTKRRKLTRNSPVGKILSTTHGRGNSSGAPRAVGVSNRVFLTSVNCTP